MKSLNTKANAKAASTAPATRGSRSGAAVSRTSKTSEHIIEKSDVRAKTNAENESPEKIEEIVQSLVAEVISKVEAEFGANPTSKRTSDIQRRRSAEALRCFDGYAASEERRRRIERGDSEAQLEEILHQVFAVPTTVNRFVLRRKSGASVAGKTTILIASKPPKPVKMSGAHQNSSKVTATPAARVAKPSSRSSESPKKSPKKPAPVGDSKSKHADASAVAKVKPAVELSKSDSRKAMVLDLQKVAEAPVAEPVGTTEKTEQPKSKEVSRQSSAAKLALVDKKQDTGTQKSSEIPLVETVATEQPKPKAPPRQSSAAKLPTGAVDKPQEQHSQKVASETSLPTQREEPAGAGKMAEAARAKSATKQTSTTKPPPTTGDKRPELQTQKAVERALSTSSNPSKPPAKPSVNSSPKASAPPKAGTKDAAPAKSGAVPPAKPSRAQ